MSDVVIVTGAASGLGAVYCRELATAGYTVVGADLDPVDGVDLGVSVDVTERASTERLAEAVLERFGRIDGLVNNAAVYSTIVKTPFEEIPDEEWDRVLDVNVKGAWLCTRAVAPAMRRQQRGKVVNISSMTVPTAPPGFAHYVASKAAIVGLTRALARELGRDGIAVNTLTPDYIAFDRDYDNRQPDMAPTLAAQRIFAREQAPEDLSAHSSSSSGRAPTSSRARTSGSTAAAPSTRRMRGPGRTWSNGRGRRDKSKLPFASRVGVARLVGTSAATSQYLRRSRPTFKKGQHGRHAADAPPTRGAGGRTESRRACAPGA